MSTQNSFFCGIYILPVFLCMVSAMFAGFTFSQSYLPVTQGRVYWIGAIQWERMAAKPTTPQGYPIKVASGGRAYSINRSGPHVYGQRHFCR